MRAGHEGGDGERVRGPGAGDPAAAGIGRGMTRVSNDPGPLTVLIGAGASFDCVDREVTSVAPHCRPPLVDDLFRSDDAFNPVLRAYPGAESLSDDIRVARRAGVPLEQILRRLAAEESLERRGRSLSTFRVRSALSVPGMSYTVRPSSRAC